jgi:hypothetical protein
MRDPNDDIIIRHHCVDDDVCPVNDLVKESNWLQLPIFARKQLEDHDMMQEAAIDEYYRVLEQTGDITKAQDAFFETHRNWHVRN